MQVELFIIEEVHVLHDDIIMDDFTEIVLRCSQAELFETDLFFWNILHSIIKNESALL